MPSNNKKNKKNSVKKAVGKEKSASAKKQLQKSAMGSTKPHFFDKSKINFSFSEKKTEVGSTFVSENEATDKAFVSAHFYHSEQNDTIVKNEAASEKEQVITLPEKTQMHTASLSELMNDDAPDKHEKSTVVSEAFPKIESNKHNSDKTVSDIGMKSLFDDGDSSSHSAPKDDAHNTMSESLATEAESAHEQASCEKSDNAPLQKTKPEEAKKKIYPQAVPTETERRRQNEALLASLKPGDIKKNSVKEKKNRVLSFLRYFAMAVCLVVLVISSLTLVSDFARKSREKDKNDEFRDAFNSGVIGYTTLGYARQDTNLEPDERLYTDEGNIYKAPEPEVYDMHEKYERMLPNLLALKYVNSSAFAWIKVAGTRVDYPVVRSPQGDNDYYLSHGIDRTYSVSGAVFTDFNNSTRLSNNRNTCVYGHNMNDGTMFQTIMNFKEKNQFLNSTIEMYTTEGLYVYTPFAAYDALPTESFFKTEFSSEEEFLAFLSEIKSKSIFSKPGISLDKNSKIVTLITCTNTVTDKRFVVHGVLDEIVK